MAVRARALKLRGGAWRTWRRCRWPRRRCDVVVSGLALRRRAAISSACSSEWARVLQHRGVVVYSTLHPIGQRSGLDAHVRVARRHARRCRRTGTRCRSITTRCVARGSGDRNGPRARLDARRSSPVALVIRAPPAPVALTRCLAPRRSRSSTPRSSPRTVGLPHRCACAAARSTVSAPRRDAAIVVVDLDEAVVLPGLINAHDHLELNSFPRLKWRPRYTQRARVDRRLPAALRVGPGARSRPAGHARRSASGSAG